MGKDFEMQLFYSPSPSLEKGMGRLVIAAADTWEILWLGEPYCSAYAEQIYRAYDDVWVAMAKHGYTLIDYRVGDAVVLPGCCW